MSSNLGIESSRGQTDVQHTKDDPDQRLWARLLGATEITTMERKYAWHPRIAEFWCAVTSPMFALPLLLYYVHGGASVHGASSCLASFPPMTHLAIALSVTAAVASTAYHSCPNRLLSTCDTCVAALAFYMHTMALLWVARHDQMMDEIWGSSIDASLWAWFVNAAGAWFSRVELLTGVYRQTGSTSVLGVWQSSLAHINLENSTTCAGTVSP